MLVSHITHNQQNAVEINFGKQEANAFLLDLLSDKIKANFHFFHKIIQN